MDKLKANARMRQRIPPESAELLFGARKGEWMPVEVCPAQQTNDTWTLWSYAWRPPGSGTYELRMRIDDPAIPTVRLDSGFYVRSIAIDEGAGPRG